MPMPGRTERGERQSRIQSAFLLNRTDNLRYHLIEVIAHAICCKAQHGKSCQCSSISLQAVLDKGSVVTVMSETVNFHQDSSYPQVKAVPGDALIMGYLESCAFEPPRN